MSDLTVTEQRLAQRLAELRVEQGGALEALAATTGISRASLSRIERGETSPTAALMNRLCIAYGLTMSRLLSEVEWLGPQHLRPDQQNLWHDRQNGFQRRSVSPPARGFQGELVEGKLISGARILYDAPPVEGLEQHIWMLAGVLEFGMNGQQWRLQAGDCLRFHLSGCSSFYAPEAEGAHYALVVCR